MRTALLISTYNWPLALELILLSIESQSVKPDELVIADDGSGKETRDLINKFKKQTSLKVSHIWHEDNGFQKSIILNKAIAQSEVDYIIQADGDCILHPDYVSDHIRLARKNTYLYGSRVSIKKNYLKELFETKSFKFNFFSKGIRKRTRALRVHLFSTLYLSRKEMSKKMRGCNISFWKKDFISINGYNEDMTGWGREDSELIIRMINFGCLGKRIRYSGIVYHIWHKTLSIHRLNINDLIQQKAVDEKLIKCQNGIDKYL